MLAFRPCRVSPYGFGYLLIIGHTVTIKFKMLLRTPLYIEGGFYLLD